MEQPWRPQWASLKKSCIAKTLRAGHERSSDLNTRNTRQAASKAILDDFEIEDPPESVAACSNMA